MCLRGIQMRLIMLDEHFPTELGIAESGMNLDVGTKSPHPNSSKLAIPQFFEHGAP